MFAHGENRPFLDREFDGYFYISDGQHNGTQYLRCKEKHSKNCYARGKIIAGRTTFEGMHSHPADNSLIRKKRFNDALFAAVTSSLRSFRDIYDELCLRDPNGAAEVPFIAAEQSMFRWRKINCPPIPRTLVEYVEYLRMERWQRFTTYGNGQLSVSAIRSEDGSTSVVYGDIGFIRRITTNRMYVDATFAVCPHTPKILQLLTIMVEVDDSTLPIAWAIMERKTYRAYVSVFEHFSTILAPHIRPLWFMTDFESALPAALASTYPEAIGQRCYFHYCQALRKRAKTERLLPRIRNSEDMQIVFRKLMALPLLPTDHIPTAFRWIIANTPLDIAMEFAQLFQYIDTYWLNIIGPNVLSVFGMQTKTNNAIEAYHRVLKKRIGVHPCIWQFTESLRRLQIVIRSSNVSLDSGLPISRPSAECYIVQQQILSRAWELFVQNLLDIPRFLACASSFLRAFNRRSIMISAHDVDHFVHRVANGVNEHHAEILAEENLEHIRILRRQLDDGSEEIIVLPGLDFQPCTLCGVNLTDTICLPCCHWIACFTCTSDFIQLAATENSDIRCSVCMVIVERFHQIIVRD